MSNLVFIPKSKRVQQAAFEEEERQRAEEARLEKERNVQEAKDLVASLIKRDAEEEQERYTIVAEDILSIDDRDLEENQCQEYEAWMLRELKRLKRREEEIQEALDEQLALQEIRALKGEALEAYLAEKAQAIEAEKEAEEEAPKSFQFLQKYYHQGAFFHEDLQTKDSLFKRDVAALPTQAEAGIDKSLLPELMQVRDFGKSSRSKWKHLSAEDTTAYDGPWYTSKKKLKQDQIDSAKEKPK